MDVTIIGNFDVISRTNEFSFSKNRYWYEYFTGDSIEIQDGKITVELKPGEFRIYTSEKIPTPANGKELITDLKNNHEEKINTYTLSQNYPNPFNPITTITYQIPQTDRVILKVYDVLGREIKTLVDEIKQPGRYEVEFNASGLSSGIYFYRIQAGSYSETKNMILLK